MSRIDPFFTLLANETPVAQASLQVQNPDSSRLGCHCGRCPHNEETADIDRAVDACLMDALNLVDTLSNSPHVRNTGDLLGLHSLHGLLTHGRLMCCVQRYAGGGHGV